MVRAWGCSRPPAAPRTLARAGRPEPQFTVLTPARPHSVHRSAAAAAAAVSLLAVGAASAHEAASLATAASVSASVSALLLQLDFLGARLPPPKHSNLSAPRQRQRL